MTADTEGHPSFRILDAMARSEFDVYGFVPGFVDRGSGRMLQIDGVFFKRTGCELHMTIRYSPNRFTVGFPVIFSKSQAVFGHSRDTP